MGLSFRWRDRGLGWNRNRTIDMAQLGGLHYSPLCIGKQSGCLMEVVFPECAPPKVGTWEDGFQCAAPLSLGPLSRSGAEMRGALARDGEPRLWAGVQRHLNSR